MHFKVIAALQLVQTFPSCSQLFFKGLKVRISLKAQSTCKHGLILVEQFPITTRGFMLLRKGSRWKHKTLKRKSYLAIALQLRDNRPFMGSLDRKRISSREAYAVFLIASIRWVSEPHQDMSVRYEVRLGGFCSC